MHSADLKVTDDAFSSYIDSYTAILQIPAIYAFPEAKSAINDLNEVCWVWFHIIFFLSCVHALYCRYNVNGKWYLKKDYQWVSFHDDVCCFQLKQAGFDFQSLDGSGDSAEMKAVKERLAEIRELLMQKQQNGGSDVTDDQVGSVCWVVDYLF